MQKLKTFPLKIEWTGAAEDLSGYGEATREYIRAMDKVGLYVAVDSKSFEPWRPQHLVDKIVERRMRMLMQRSRKDAPIHVIHLTADLYPGYVKEKKYRIGYFAWETSVLHERWVKAINSSVHEVWVPCEWNKIVAERSGVTVPIVVVPHAIPLPTEEVIGQLPVCKIEGFPEDHYLFYSISQWSWRKGFDILLKAYFQEFSQNENVCLLIKSYPLKDLSGGRLEIREEIRAAKNQVGKGDSSPKVLLIEEFLSTMEINSLHHYGDCYVTSARAEGFGIGAFQAASFGNPVIVPNYSSFPDHFNEDNAYLVDVPKESKISGMEYISFLYNNLMSWGEPSVDSLRSKMREVFNNKEKADGKGTAGRKMVETSLSYQQIGGLIKERIEFIYRDILKVKSL